MTDLFKMSEELGALAPDLLAFQREVKDPKKNSVNPHFGNKFAGLEDSIEALRPLANKHNFTITQWRVGKGLVTLFLHDSGEYIWGAAEMIIEKLNPQALGSATTYERRYSLLGATGTSGDVDTDAEEAMVHHQAPDAAAHSIADTPQSRPRVPNTSLADSFAERIGSCVNVAELEQVGAQMAHAGLKEEDKELLRHIYAKTKERLSA